MNILNRLFHKKVTEGEVVDLVEENRYFNVLTRSYDSIEYGIFLHHTNLRVGYCDLRFGMNEELYYAGNVGYRIYEPYRGHGYAYEACLLLEKVARKYRFQYLIITCSPGNIASKKTIEKLDGVLLETTEVPVTHWLYRRGETVKSVYQLDL